MAPPRYTVGVLLFPGFEVLDVFGPAEAFGLTRYPDQDLQDPGPRPFQLVYLAERPGPVKAGNGGNVQILPDATIDAAPPLDLLLVPGGLGTRQEIHNRALVDWLRQVDGSLKLMTTVCTGAALLAQTGLLNGRKATTNHRAFDWVVQSSPKEIEWTKELRWVEDGHYVTSAGVSAGTDMACHLVHKLLGPEAARRTVLSMEYDWTSDPEIQPPTF